MAALVLGCSDATAPGGVIALVVRLPASGPVTVEEEDTTRVDAWTVSQSGDSATDGITWREFTSRGVIALDSTTGEIVGLIGDDTTTIQAQFANLRSNPIPVRVLAAADSIAAMGSTVDTVAVGDSLSAPLSVTLLDLTTVPGTPRGLSDRPVRFEVLDSPAGVELVEAPDSAGVTRQTASDGTTAVTLRRTGVQPAADSVVVEAGAARATGSVVSGSPVRFVVYFQ
jgi:hypothetical protein